MLTCMPPIRKSLLLSCLIVIPFLSCRTGKRATSVDDDGPSATIRLAGLEDSDKARTDFVYELGECTGGWVGGSLATDGRVKFTAKGLKSNQTCSIRIRNPEVAGDARFKWVDGTAGTLYAASDILLKPDVDGTLIGTAALSKNFQLKSSNFFSLTIGVTFPDDIQEGKLYKSEISCTPQLHAVGILAKTTPRQGSFLFEEPVSPDIETKYTCQKMAVWIVDAPRYNGALGTANAPLTFSAKAGQKLAPQKDAVVLKSLSAEGGGGQTGEQIIVNTIEGKCAEGEVFDVTSAKCIKP